MTGDERVRHCQECKLNVYNLSEMTRTEAEQLVANREGRMCVRFYRRADGTILTRNCPRRLQAVARRLSRLAGAALSAMMSMGTAFAQASTQPSPQNKSDQAAQKAAKLEITVVDSAGAPIPGAKVSVASQDGQNQFTGKTQDKGVVSVFGMPPGPAVLRIDRQGFKSYRNNIAIDKNRTKTLRIKLEIAAETIGIVVLTPPLMDQDSATIQTTISGDLIRQLPLR